MTATPDDMARFAREAFEQTVRPDLTEQFERELDEQCERMAAELRAFHWRTPVPTLGLISTLEEWELRREPSKVNRPPSPACREEGAAHD